MTSATGRLVPVLAYFQAILQACPYPLFLAYAHPGDQRAEQPEGALGPYLAGPLHPAARGNGLERQCVADGRSDLGSTVRRCPLLWVVILAHLITRARESASQADSTYWQTWTLL